MGCPDEVKVLYCLPAYNEVNNWQSKTFEHCESYLITRAGTLKKNRTFFPYTGLFEIHSYDIKENPIAFTFTFKDGIVQDVKPGRFYGQ